MRRLAWFSFLLLFAAAAGAGVNQWTSITPPGVTEVLSFVVDPSNPDTLYVVSSYPSLWRSRDRGASWEVVGSGFAAVQVVVDRNNRDHLLLLDGFSFRQSLDGGNSWSSLVGNWGGYGRQMRASSDARTIYVAARQFCVFKCDGGGIWKSVDGGAKWTKAGLNDLTIALLELDPRDANTVYASAIDVGKDGFFGAGSLFRTRDGGRNWTRIGPSVSMGNFGNVVGSGSQLLIDPVVTSKLYLSAQDGLWTSDDGGDNWAQLQSFTPTGLAFDPADPNALFAALRGQVPASPCPPDPPPPPPPPCPMMPCPPAPPICPPEVTPPPNLPLGVMRSADGGRTWTRVVVPAVPGDTGGNTATGLTVDPRQMSFYQLLPTGVFEFTPSAAPRRRAVKR